MIDMIITLPYYLIFVSHYVDNPLQYNTTFSAAKCETKAIKTQPKQNFSKFLKQNHIVGCSSEDDKPLIFLTKYKKNLMLSKIPHTGHTLMMPIHQILNVQKISQTGKEHPQKKKIY